MKYRLKRMAFLVMMSGLFLIGGNQAVQAANEPYTIDQAPLNPPDFSNYETVDITSESQLKTKLADNTTNVTYVLQNDLELSSQLSIQGNKAINLNGHLLSATKKGSLLIPDKSTTTQFKLYNGNLSGGPEMTTIGADTNTTNAFFNVDYQVESDVVLEDITYQSSDNGGSFFKGMATNIFSLGTVNITTYCTNIRAANMTFLGDFNGVAFGKGNLLPYGIGDGGVNLSFGGYGFGYRNPFNKKGNGKDSEAMSQSVGDRRLYIAPESHVSLKNTDSSTTGSAYRNNIANFSTINIDGSLIAESFGPSLRSTAAYLSTSDEYKNKAGTYNGMSNVTINENAIFKIASTDTVGTYGALYTYSTNVYSYKPKVFDMRYFGKGQSFWSWPENLRSNMYLYDLNIGVWDKGLKGVGNPTLAWSNVDWLSVEKFWTTHGGTVSSSNEGVKGNFTIGNYSRISNDIALPKMNVDNSFIDADENVFLNNGDSVFSGSTAYTEEDEVLDNRVAVGATVTLSVNGKTYTTKTDDSGKWKFSDLDLTNVKGGTVATLNLTDTDFRTAPEINVTIKDTTPPVVSPKLIKVVLGDTSALQNPKEGILSAKDETTSDANLAYEFITSEEERKEMIKQLGVYNIDIKVSDEAGNSTSVTAPVIVYPEGEKIDDGFVTGNDFTIDYNSWTGLTDDEKRNLIIEKGQVKGYQINESTVTDVTDDPTQLLIDFQTATWEPNQTYPVIVSVGKFKKTINVTIVPNTVKMTIKQIYQGTDEPIYSDLESKTLVDNTQSIEVANGDELKEVINKELSDGNFTLNYEGYGTQTMTAYKIYENGTEIVPTPTKVPNEDFTIVYEYQGQLKFQETAKNLDFGSVEITAGNSETALSDSSDKTISIINTVKNASWKLKASLPNGITKENSNQSFLGTLFYKNTDGTETTLGTSSIQIETQTDDELYSQLSLKNNDKASGLYLHQDDGNLKGSYSGTMIWTLEDTP